MAERETKKLLCYYSARDGMCIRLFDMLDGMSADDAKYCLESVTEDQEQKCTPLIIAILNCHNNVVNVLLLKFKFNLEKEGTVVIDGYHIEGITALWCAANAGNFHALKALLRLGARVDHPTLTMSTPLRAACFCGHLGIVKFLVENGANVHSANIFNSTCLMISAYRGKTEVVAYLLSQDADINAQAQCGATALHFAVEPGYLKTAKLLLNSGAKILKNNMGMSPLIVAANQTQTALVQYLISTELFPEPECLDALELLGASFANDKEHYNLIKSYMYLEMAMKMRYSNIEYFGHKPFVPPLIAYDNHIECQTLEELQAIKHNTNALYMESLLIRERILGSHNPEVPHPVIFRGAVYADVGQFQKCVNLLLHALHLRHNSGTAVNEDLLRFAQLFSQMLHLGEEITFTSLHQVLSVVLEELKNNLESKKKPKNTDSKLSEKLEGNILTVLYLFVVITKVIKNFSDEEKQALYRLAYRIIKLPLRTKKGSMLLHLAVCTDTHVDDFHTKNVCKFPCALTTRLLIKCGADVNIIDNNGNTPLHIIVAYQKPITDFTTLHSIIIQLIEAGTHLDCVNSNNETPAEAVLTGVAEIILKAQCQISLKCLAAKAVRRFNLTYDSCLPDSLKKFTDMHGIPPQMKLLG